jgi:hypothetical protein
MLQPRLWQAVGEVWSVAQRGAALSGAAPDAAGSRDQLSAELQRVQGERLRLDPAATAQAEVLAGREAAIAAQIRAAKRAEDAAGEAADRLRLMTAQLDDAVTQVLQLGLRRDDAEAGVVDALGPSIDGLLEQIGALQEGLRAVEGLGQAPSLGTGAGRGESPTRPAGPPPAASGPPPAPSPPAAS